MKKKLKDCVTDPSQPWQDFVLAKLQLDKNATLDLMKDNFNHDALVESGDYLSIKFITGVTYEHILHNFYDCEKRPFAAMKTTAGTKKTSEADRMQVKQDSLKIPQMRALIVEPRQIVELIYNRIPDLIVGLLQRSESNAAARAEAAKAAEIAAAAEAAEIAEREEVLEAAAKAEAIEKVAAMQKKQSARAAEIALDAEIAACAEAQDRAQDAEAAERRAMRKKAEALEDRQQASSSGCASSSRTGVSAEVRNMFFIRFLKGFIIL
jgi:hypothetical protein